MVLGLNQAGSSFQLFILLYLLYTAPYLLYTAPYLLYTAPLAEVIRSYDLDYHLYADDTQLYFSFISVDNDAAKSRVEDCISAICHWMNLNELKLNHNKTEVILIHSKYRPHPSFQSCVLVMRT